MRASVIAFATLASIMLGTAQAQNPDVLEAARRIAAAGAVDLALARVEQGQPPQPSAPSWSEWERLRLGLLARKGRDEEVLARVRALDDVALAPRAAAPILALAARSALRLGQPMQARRFLLRLFLRPDLNNDDYRFARLAVIDTYIEERNAEAAYRSMLRFQQDFPALQQDEVERFVAGLMTAGRNNEAAAWLAKLDPSSPWAWLLRLRAGLITPEAAIARARALLAKGDDAALELLATAGRAQNARAVEVEVREAELNATRPASRPALSERTAALWKLYADAAQFAANQAQLLSGNDAAWANQAARMLSVQPQLARALLAHLALEARSTEVRANAQLQMIDSLREGKLTLAAWRLFTEAQRFSPSDMDARVRFQLGMLGTEVGQPAAALRYWQGLPAPSGMTAQEWQVRRLALLIQAGAIAEALGAARTLLEPKPPLTAQLVQRLIDLAADAVDSGQAEVAATLLGLLLPSVADAQRARVLSGLAKAHESSGDFRAAAAVYIQSASLAAAPEADRAALEAREAAAKNLLRAGLRDDARALYQWLARNAKDNAIKDAASQALRKLGPRLN